MTQRQTIADVADESVAICRASSKMSNQGDILQTICDKRSEDVELARASVHESVLASRIKSDFPCVPLDLYEHVTRDVTCFSVAAEFKRASPSKGAFVEEGVQVSDHARSYMDGGACILSVLTEPHWFKGSPNDLREARLAAEAWAEQSGKPRPALLRKEFVLDAYQIVEARAWGADTVLLIVSMLPTVAQLSPLIQACRQLGMEPLVEVNSVDEMRVALDADSRVVGINNRNLRTFTVDLDTTTRVVQYAVEQHQRALATDQHARPVAILSLSGLKSGDDVLSLATSVAQACKGASHPRTGEMLAFQVLRGFLVGEALMRADDKAGMVAELVSAGRVALQASAVGQVRSTDVEGAVKVCGLKTTEAAVHAAKAEADFCGIIMVPGTPRGVSAQVARGITSAIRAYREQDPRYLLDQARTVQLTPGVQDGAPDVTRLHECAQHLRAAAKRARPLCVGVFMDQDPSVVVSMAEEGGLDVIQLHGSEVPAHYAPAHCPFPVIKVLHVPVDGQGNTSDTDLCAVLERMVEWSRVAVAVLLDSKAQGGGSSGGTGHTFNHSRVMQALAAGVSASCAPKALPLMLAGGLTPENVSSAVAACSSQEAATTAHVRVWAVDVSSGVEFTPGTILADGSTAGKGQKDPVKVAAFVRAGRSALLKSANS